MAAFRAGLFSDMRVVLWWHFVLGLFADVCDGLWLRFERVRVLTRVSFFGGISCGAFPDVPGEAVPIRPQ